MSTRTIHISLQYRLLICVLLSAVLIISAPAGAGAGGAGGDFGPLEWEIVPGERVQLAVSGSAVSDYVSRGFSETRGQPAAQAEADIIWKSFYVGLWTSGLNYGTQPSRAAALVQLGDNSPEVETDFYVGYIRSIGNLDIEAQATYDAYPEGKIYGGPLDYWEFKIGGIAHIQDSLSLGLSVYYSPDYYAGAGSNLILKAKAKKIFAPIDIFTPSISGSISNQEGDESRGGLSYWFYDVGGALSFYDHFKIDLRYYNTASVPIDCQGFCGARVVGAFKVEM